MIQSTADMIKEHLCFNCSICFQDYNSTDHFPYEICNNSHSVCKHCLTTHLEKSYYPKCPQCRQNIYDYSSKKFPKRLANQLVSIIEQAKKKDGEVQTIIQKGKQRDDEVLIIIEEAKKRNEEVLIIIEEGKKRDEEVQIIIEEARKREKQIQIIIEKGKKRDDKVLVIIEEAKRRENQLLIKIKQTQWLSLKRQSKLIQQIQDKKRLRKQAKKLSQKLDTTFNELSTERSNVSHLDYQKISLQQKLQQKNQQNTSFKIIFIYIILAIFYLIFFDKTQVNYSQQISQDRFMTDLNQQTSLNQTEIRLGTLKSNSLRALDKSNNRMPQLQQLLKDQDQQQKKVNLITQQILTIQNKKQQQLQKIKAFLKSKSQFLPTQLLTIIQNSKTLKNFQKLFENLTQHKKQLTKVGENKKSIFNAQVQQNQQLLKFIKQTWSQIKIQSKKNNKKDHL